MLKAKALFPFLSLKTNYQTTTKMVESNSILNKEQTLKNIEDRWDSWYVKGLGDFIKVPNLTPMVDPDFLTNGLI